METALSESTEPRAAERGVAAANAAVRERFPFADTRDFDDASRGFLGTADDPAHPGRDVDRAE